MDEAGIPFLSATELSRLIERREVSPVEATAAYLERIDDLDFKFNAYLTVCRDQALQDAREAERAISQGNYIGPMHGVPVAVKDQFWSKGIRSTGGSRILADFIPDEDATVVANLKKAGAILLGKTNVTELAISGFTHRFSTPRNPWNLDMYAGGSSGGSGAGTAAFLCATSLGEDTGGSIRFPATWCGLVGHRPSWGLVSRYGVMRGVWSMDTVGPISRTVEDAAITLGAIAGYDPKDPYTWNTPVPDYRAALDGNIKGLKVGVVKEVTDGEMIHPEVRDAVMKAAGVLGELGASVEEISIPLSAEAWTILGPLRIEAPLQYKDFLKNRLQEIGHDNQIAYLVNSVLPAQYYYKAQKLRTILRNQVIEALENVDVWIMPTSGATAGKIAPPGTPISRIDSPEKAPFVGKGSASLVTAMASVSSTPAISVPCGFNSQNLPVGLQIGGRNFDESTVLNVAYAYEQATPWHTMRPPPPI
jgi:aspartyl-tRNA(Asn)/glutamyl-tRNA(Gln) amidotransferase subunit A